MKSKNIIKQHSNFLQTEDLKQGKKLLQFLNRNKNLISPMLILTHDHPDPDGLACAYALHYLAEKVYGINARIAYSGIIGRPENRTMVKILNIPINKLRASELNKYQHIALVDTQPGFENNVFPDKKIATIVIDQHVSVKSPEGKLVIVDTKCGASCIILAQAFLSLKIAIPAKIATALVYGVITDTQNLYRARQSDVIRIYMDMMLYCDMRALARIQSPLRNKQFFIKMNDCLNKAKTAKGLIFSHLKEVGAPDVVSQFSDFLLTYEKAKWAFCTGRYQGKLYVSLRMIKTDVVASKILRDIFPDSKDAGGHETIAGGCLNIGKDVNKNSWIKAENELIKRLLRRLKIPLTAKFSLAFK